MIMKQIFLKAWLGMAICLATFSCGITELGGVEKDETNGVWNSPVMDTPALDQRITFVSAFDYPEGYDWHSDPERGERKCSLVVFRDGVPSLKIPVGDKYNVSPDPDMHRIVNGHLYTDFSTSSETIIKKDGKPLFSYQKPEMICDFKVYDDQVHTLGHSRSGGGFSYRVNGAVVLERSNGYTFERIMVQDTIVSIAFVEPIASADGVIERYYVMIGGKVAQVALRNDIRKVWDVAVINGETYYLASLVGLSAPVLVSDNGLTALSIPSSVSLVSCRMIVMDNGICVEGILSNGKNVESILWNQDFSYQRFPKGMTFSALSYSNDVVHCAINPTVGGGVGLIYRGDESHAMPMDYACMSRDAIDFSSGILSVGLSSLTGDKPVLWVDGQLKTVDVNGFISSVESESL